MRATTRGSRPTVRGAGLAVVCAALLAGCSTAAPEPPPAAPPSAPAPSATAPAPSTPEEVVCADYRTEASLLRRTAEALEQMPVLPAGLNLILLNVRQVAQTPGVEDVALAAAQIELVAAIDDLDAQGRALIGPDGDAVTDAVQFDAERILAAVTEIERVCGAR